MLTKCSNSDQYVLFLISFNLHSTWSWFYYSHFTDEETEVEMTILSEIIHVIRDRA